MPTDRIAPQTIAQADTLIADETPISLVDTGGGGIDALLVEARYSGGALLGQGGMGEVRLYRDKRLGREVAVKVLRPAAGSLGARQRRFIREARVQGQLEHPSVVPVYDLDVTPDGDVRITMKRVRGHTLETVIAGLANKDPILTRRFSRRRLMTAFVSVCRALDYAHTRGVIHRDVKPANVMLGDFGEVHVLDWGIAKVPGSGGVEGIVTSAEPSTALTIDPPQKQADPAKNKAPSPAPARPATAVLQHESTESQETIQGAIFGTPGYMSPEQAMGHVDLIDARSDVFALGAMLFEILTLTPMIDGATVQEKLFAARELSAPESPAARSPDLDSPPELDEAVRRATAPHIEERYPSAGALAEAVDRYLDGDRDVAARRALAGEHVEEAREMLRSSNSGVEEAESRASAVRTLTRAVALDPHHQEASELLAQLLVETPKTLPREAAAELTAAREVARKTAALGGVYRMVGVVVLGILGAYMGVRSAFTGVATLATLFLASALSMLWLRFKSEPAREVNRLITLALTIVSLTCMSYAFGPVILVPTLCMVNGFVLLGQADFRSVSVVIGASIIPVVWRFVLGLADLAPMPYQITQDRIVIPASAIGFPPVLTLTILAFVALLQVVAPLVMVSLLRDRLRSLEERLFLHSYHLRRLATSPGGEISPRSR